MSGEAILRADGVSRVFAAAGGDVHACTDIDLAVHAGELVVVRGASGAGKTTLLNLLSGLDEPTSGRVLLDGTDLASLSEADLADVRHRALGIVFQSFGLIPVLSAAENVEVPLRIARTEPRERDERVATALAEVGLSGQAAQRPDELSGGQQQRVATEVLDLIAALTHERGIAAVVATHDPLLVARADRVIELHDGRITESQPVAAAFSSRAAWRAAQGGGAEASP